MKVGMALKRNEVKLRQPNQHEGMENTKSPQFKHIESGDWAGSRKSSLAPFRLSCDSTVEVLLATRFWHSGFRVKIRI